MQHRAWIVRRAGGAGACTACLPDSQRHPPQPPTTATRKNKCCTPPLLLFWAAAQFSQPVERTAVRTCLMSSPFACITTTHRHLCCCSSCAVVLGSSSPYFLLAWWTQQLRHSSRAPPATTREDNSSSSGITPAALLCLSTPHAMPLSCRAEVARPALRRTKIDRTETPQNLLIDKTLSLSPGGEPNTEHGA